MIPITPRRSWPAIDGCRAGGRSHRARPPAVAAWKGADAELRIVGWAKLRSSVPTRCLAKRPTSAGVGRSRRPRPRIKSGAGSSRLATLLWAMVEPSCRVIHRRDHDLAESEPNGRNTRMAAYRTSRGLDPHPGQQRAACDRETGACISGSATRNPTEAIPVEQRLLSIGLKRLCHLLSRQRANPMHETVRFLRAPSHISLQPLLTARPSRPAVRQAGGW
jgi:hypothetical protein